MIKDNGRRIFDIPANKEMTSQGRNGRAWTVGIEVMEFSDGDRVTLIPITSKGNFQNCEIQVTPEVMTEIAKWWLERQGEQS